MTPKPDINRNVCSIAAPRRSERRLNMNNRQREDLDRHTTGNYGEDSVPDDEDETMTIDDYARSKAQPFRDKGCFCWDCIYALIDSAYTQGASDQKRAAVAALAKLENDAWCVDGGLVSKGRARQAVIDSQPDASKGEKEAEA